jgi:phosphate transport system substrate-binding protein
MIGREVAAPELDPDRPPDTARPHSGRRRAVVSGVLVVVILLLSGAYGWSAGWFATPSTGPVCTGTIALTGAVAGPAVPLFQLWGANYSALHHCIVVDLSRPAAVPFGNASGGPSEEFWASEAPLNASATGTAGVPVLTIPMAATPLAVVYDLPGVSTGLHLSAAVLAGMYEGTVTSWNSTEVAALNPGDGPLPDLPVKPLFDAAGAGENWVVSSWLSLGSAGWNASVGRSVDPAWPVGTSAANDSTLVADVAQTPGAVGFAGLGYAEEAAVGVAALENPNGSFVSPTAASAADAVEASPARLPAGNSTWWNYSLLDVPSAAAYPLVSYTYVFLYEDLGHLPGSPLDLNSAKWLASFLIWTLQYSEGATTPLEFVAPPVAVGFAAQETVEQLKFNGAWVLCTDADCDNDGR